MTVLVVSPHLDDAVLSLPVSLSRRARAGHRMIVATVFSEGRDGARRREEDLAALARLGCEPRHLGLLDAPERRGLPRDGRALLLAPVASDDPDVSLARQRLEALARELAPESLWLPLGVGEHVDHRVVHEAGRELSPPPCYYEDRPYACVRHATALRLRRLGVTGVEPPPLAEFVAAALAAPFARTYLPRGSEGEALLRAVGAESQPRPPARLDTVHAIDPPEVEVEEVLRAVSAYASQLVDLFAGHEPRRILRDPDGAYRERLHELRAGRPP